MLNYSTASSSTTVIPHVNCTLTTSVQSLAPFPLILLLLLTGIILIAIDISVTFLLCIIKYKSCGVLVVVWYLITTVCILAWTIWSVLNIIVVFPAWLEERFRCDDLVMIMTLGSVVYCGVLSVIYLIVIVVVVIFDYNRWYETRDL